MITITKKVLTTVATGVLVISMLAPLTFAETNIHIGNTGQDSENTMSILSQKLRTLWEKNMTEIRNNTILHLNSSTSPTQNNDGNVTIHTGETNSNVHFSTHTNLNTPEHGDSDDMSDHKRLLATLSGDQEVPGLGDPNGYGLSTILLHPKQNEVCVILHVANIQTASAAHIHQAGVGAAGPVVVQLPTPNAAGYTSGCMNIDTSLIQEMQTNPEHFYVNVHNSEYPNGAIRGQLSL